MAKSKKKHVGLALSLVLTLSGLAACNNDVSSCTENSDCSTGQICVQGTCTTPSCISNTDCNEGLICKDGTCTTGCIAHTDCPTGQICDSNSCIAGCIDDKGCDIGSYCNIATKQCVKGCLSNANCDTGMLCLYGSCSKASDTCNNDGMCGSGKICEANQCVPGCRNNAGCNIGQTCENGQCKTPAPITDPCEGVTCNNDEKCVNGECVPLDRCEGITCNNDEKCVNGECVPDAVDPCDACSDNQDCINGECVDPDPCANCKEDEICSNDKCVPKEDPCAACTGEQTCVNNQCVDPIDPCAACSDEEFCFEGKCVDCLQTSDCGNCKICENHVCLVDPQCSVEPECTQASDCGVCKLCEQGACVEDPTCTSAECLDEPKGNVVPNWDFEDWSGNVPKSWSPEREIIYSKVTTAHSCNAALKLENELTNNGRMASTPVELPVGKYSCSVWLKGEGTVRFGARVPADSNTYKYSAEQKLLGIDEFREYKYSVNVSSTSATVSTSFILAVKNTENPHVTVDAFSCVRQGEVCDNVTCKTWETCQNKGGLAVCVPDPNRCNINGDCREWQTCNTAEHTCVIAEGRCENHDQCKNLTGALMKCDLAKHTCVSGDPCENVKCQAWKVCNPTSGQCELPDGNCTTSADCLKDKPACDPETHTCQDATHPCNVFPNGGFESWDYYYIPYHGEDNLIPDEWYGLFDDLTDHTGATELKPSAIKQYTTNVHSGQYAMQIVQPNGVDRLASEPFKTPSGKKTTCSYWVRGKGGVRDRGYSNLGWTPQTDRLDIDTDEWIRIPFKLPANANNYRFILYVTYTDPAKDHVQIDDIVCTVDNI